MARVFISYRRCDSLAWAHRVFDALAERLGRDSVFIDIPSIPYGKDFKEHIRTQLAESETLVAVIGPGWLDAPSRDGSGGRRLDEFDDIVRGEIETALEADLLVIPVLVDGAKMPAEQELPAVLARLANRNALPVHPEYFRAAIDKICETAEESAGSDRGLLKTFLSEDGGILGVGWSMYLPNPDGVVELPAWCKGWQEHRRWIRDQGGGDYGSTWLRLDLICRGREPVQVLSIGAKLINKLERGAGARVVSPSAGDSVLIPAVLDLDDQGPIARKAVRSFQDYRAWAPSSSDFEVGEPLILTVAPGELVSVRILARARKVTCRWVLELSVVESGRQSTLTLPSDGSAFFTVAPHEDDLDYLLAWFLRPNLLGPADVVRDLSQSP